MTDWHHLIAAGFAVGAVIGMTGVGGGSLMTPLLILWFKVPPAVAVGTDLLYAAITKCGGLWAHQRRKNVCWGTVAAMAAGSIPGATITIILLRLLRPDSGVYDRLLTTALGVALVATGLMLIFKNQLGTYVHSSKYPLLNLGARQRWLLTATAGFVLGILVTLSSVGAGVLGTATLLVLYPHLRMMQIVGTDLAHAIPITAIAGLGHAHLGTVDWKLLTGLLIGSIPGTFLGSHMGHMLPDKWVRMILATILLLIGIKMAAGI